MIIREDAAAACRQAMPKLSEYFKKYFDDDKALEGAGVCNGWRIVKPVLVGNIMITVSISATVIPPPEEYEV